MEQRLVCPAMMTRFLLEGFVPQDTFANVLWNMDLQLVLLADAKIGIASNVCGMPLVINAIAVEMDTICLGINAIETVHRNMREWVSRFGAVSVIYHSHVEDIPVSFHLSPLSL